MTTPTKPEDRTVIFDGEAQTRWFQFMAQRSGLRLEIKGLKHSSGRSIYAHVKRLYRFRGKKERVLEQMQRINFDQFRLRCETCGSLVFKRDHDFYGVKYTPREPWDGVKLRCPGCTECQQHFEEDCFK